MNMPKFTADASLYKSTTGYLAAPNRAALSEGAVTPALMKKVCGDVTQSRIKTPIGTVAKSCSNCQWWVQVRVCADPGKPKTCGWQWVPFGDASEECHCTLLEIE